MTAAYKDQIDALQRQVQDVNAQVDELRRTVASLVEERQRHESENVALSSRVTELERKLEQIS